MAVRYDQYPMGFVPKIFPIAIQLEGETNGDQIDNMREAVAITLLDLIENRIIECEGRKKQEARNLFLCHTNKYRDYGASNGIGTLSYLASFTNCTLRRWSRMRTFNFSSLETES